MTMQSASKSGLAQVCRLCLANNGQLYRIFGGGIDDLAEKVCDITALELEDIDGIPSMICELCRSQVLVSHQFVLQCRISDWKYKKRLVEARPVQKDSKSPRLSTNSSSSGIGELAADEAGPSPTVTTKTVAAIPLKPNALHRLRNDDRASRRHSIDQVRKVPAKKPPKRRLSDSSQYDPVVTKIKVEPTDEDLEDRDNRKKQCPTCGQLVIRLEKHMKTMHADVPKHTCTVCGRSFSTSSYLTYHLNDHKGLQPYSCGKCGKRYSHRNSLWSHEKSHEIKFHCDECSAGFTHKGMLKQHMKTHNGRK